jgi:hypothetical protein
MLYCVSCDGADAYFVVEAVGRREANKMVYDAIVEDGLETQEAIGAGGPVPDTIPSFERVREYHEKEKKKKRVSMLRLLTAEPLELLVDKIYDISIGDEAE